LTGLLAIFSEKGIFALQRAGSLAQRCEFNA
jgi:hypothetical protein